MTIHRIDQFVIEDDRRISQYDEAEKALPDRVDSDRRRARYNYSQKQKIIYVPVEPVPWGPTPGGMQKGIEKFFDHTWDKPNLWWGVPGDVDDDDPSPYELGEWFAPAPDDTLILQKWPCPSCGYTLEDEQIHGDHHLCKEHDTGQQLTVVKTLGVEERKVVVPANEFWNGRAIEKIWHWKLLTKVI